MPSALPYYPDWPRVASRLPPDPALEARIETMLGQMTLEEKIGQMIQPELYELTPEEAGRYKFGSAFNAAGVWPGARRHASTADWVGTVDAYWRALDEAYAGRPFRIPFMWATDAVHGHNNVFGATIFPHNIGLGAARDPELIRRIGAATATEIAATGIDWTFAPTVTTPRDYGWGRHYEGYSEDPAIVHAYAAPMVEGLQGRAGSDEWMGHARVLSCVKHWVGDGGTAFGVDRGNTRCDEDMLRNVHATGYFSGLDAGAQSVMVSFSGWEHPTNYDHDPLPGQPYNYKVHGSRYLITDVLKQKMGFDGVVITDYEGHAEVSRCTLGDAAYAINAGVDILMVAARAGWQALYQTTLRQVGEGVIAQARIDDAVRRILRMKLRAGLWDKPAPAERPLAGRADLLGCAAHRALAREAVRKSLVLLKNNHALLPLSRKARVLITGSASASIQKQTGGWTLSWQGNDLCEADLPGASTLAAAVRAVVGEERCVLDPALAHADPADCEVAIVAIGEDAYAEMRGTIRPWRPLAYASLKTSYMRDLEILRELKRLGVPVVTVFFSGRPLYVNEELNLSDAFVASWLPGTEAGGITDLLFAPAPGAPVYDFTGRLAYSWPATKRSAAVNRMPPNMPQFQVPPEEQSPLGPHAPLFPYGYGLSLQDRQLQGAVTLDDVVDTDVVAPATADLAILTPAAAGRYRWRMTGHNHWSGKDLSPGVVADWTILRTAPVNYQGSADALRVQFKGFVGFLYAQHWDGAPSDHRPYLVAGAMLRFDVRVFAWPDAPLILALHDDYPSQPGIDIAPALRELALGQWRTISITLATLAAAGIDFKCINTPFMLYSEGRADLAFGMVEWVLPKPAE